MLHRNERWVAERTEEEIVLSGSIYEVPRIKFDENGKAWQEGIYEIIKETVEFTDGKRCRRYVVRLDGKMIDYDLTMLESKAIVKNLKGGEQA